ncbi:MmgE/PrpD family protein [Novosphingobium sp. fls2-241-R2A-195]|uniref:MmgE/PrpD family protein n=1 Tax=Novosphingobium sp. fls2-241-R2A-195 TaxID=3040296 RepID=UPI00254A03DB|nr:MmgE/PrpD family protein [Novosphingobium sp. fls2-241-R2A-195]
MSAEAAASFAASVRWSALPLPVRDRAESALKDTLGCLLAGTRSEAFAAARRAMVLDLGGSEGSSAAMCAFAWAIAASAFDHDDGHYEGGGIHPGSTVLPALLAASRGSESREDLLAALVVGYEIAIRAGYLLMPQLSGGSYRCTGAASVLGAAAAVARYRGGSADTIARAIRIAAAHGPFASLQLPMVKEAVGQAASSAVTAALLAEAGFGGGGEPFLGITPSPFDTPPFDTPQAADTFASGLGESWHILNIYAKPWPCCRAIHGALAAVEAILAQEGWSGDHVERIEVEVMPGLAALDFLPPASADHAQFSFPFAIGCLLAKGAVLPEHFLPHGRGDAAILAAGRTVTLVESSDLSPLAPNRSYPAAVTIHAAGTARRLRVDDAPGSLRAPFPLDRKYRANAALSGACDTAALPGQAPAALVAALTPFLVSPDRSMS